MTTWMELLLVFVLMLVNGLLAMAEIAVISARKARLQQWAEGGDKGAAGALLLASAPSDFLATVQIGITSVGILAGAFSGATISDELSAFISGSFPIPTHHADAISLAVVVSSVTLLALVVGELVPKRIAMAHAERIACWVSRPMLLLSNLGRPLVVGLSRTTEAIVAVLRVEMQKEPPITEDEIKVLIEQGKMAGIFNEAEQEMVSGVLALDARRVGSIMLPRGDVTVCLTSDTPEEVLRKVRESGHSFYPLLDAATEHVLGVVDVHSVYLAWIDHRSFDLATLVDDAIYVPENKTVLDLLRMFKESGQQIALVVDEYGGFQGMATLHDILEEIVGEVRAMGEGKWDIVAREDGSYLVDGLIPIDRFKDEFDIRQLPGDDKHIYQTLAGFILFQLEHMPSVGERLVWEDFSFEVVDMDGYRVDKVAISRLPAEPSSC